MNMITTRDQIKILSGFIYLDGLEKDNNSEYLRLIKQAKEYVKEYRDDEDDWLLLIYSYDIYHKNAIIVYYLLRNDIKFPTVRETLMEKFHKTCSTTPYYRKLLDDILPKAMSLESHMPSEEVAKNFIMTRMIFLYTYNKHLFKELDSLPKLILEFALQHVSDYDVYIVYTRAIGTKVNNALFYNLLACRNTNKANNTEIILQEIADKLKGEIAEVRRVIDGEI